MQYYATDKDSLYHDYVNWLKIALIIVSKYDFLKFLYYSSFSRIQDNFYILGNIPYFFGNANSFAVVIRSDYSWWIVIPFLTFHSQQSRYTEGK